MLFIVQSVQIARALTTYESMRRHAHRSSPAAEAITAAITAGTTSFNGASLTNTGVGPDPAISSGPQATAHPHKEGCFAQWKKLLGLDTFIATATGRSGRRKKGNPFSRGVVMNCRDFWFDPAPYFGRRENGAAMLNGELLIKKEMDPESMYRCWSSDFEKIVVPKEFAAMDHPITEEVGTSLMSQLTVHFLNFAPET
ncbi:MAG: hypothetical protein Q9225_003765 [Loekoesia sp. 1 TL-2023]